MLRGLYSWRRAGSHAFSLESHLGSGNNDARLTFIARRRGDCTNTPFVKPFRVPSLSPRPRRLQSDVSLWGRLFKRHTLFSRRRALRSTRGLLSSGLVTISRQSGSVLGYCYIVYTTRMTYAGVAWCETPKQCRLIRNEITLVCNYYACNNCIISNCQGF